MLRFLWRDLQPNDWQFLWSNDIWNFILGAWNDKDKIVMHYWRGYKAFTLEYIFAVDLMLPNPIKIWLRNLLFCKLPVGQEGFASYLTIGSRTI